MAKPIKRCLIIDDDESFRQLITRYINLILPEAIVEEYDPSVGGPPPLDFDWAGCDLVILDYFLNASLTGLDLLNEWKKQENFPPVIMMTAAGSEDVAVRAMKTGVQDYLRKQNLTKEKLLKAILEAVKNHEEENERRLANTQSSQSFNKSLFYKKLEQPVKRGQQPPVFVLIELDQFSQLGDERGIIVQDSLLRHIARLTYNAFSDEKYQAGMTRMSDATIALLFVLQSGESLEQALKELSALLSNDAFEYDGELIPYTVSIGGVQLSASGNLANDIISKARRVCRRVSESGGNDFAVYRADLDDSKQTPVDGEEPVTPAAADSADSDQPTVTKTAAESEYRKSRSEPAPAGADEPRAPASQPEAEPTIAEATPAEPAPAAAAEPGSTATTETDKPATEVAEPGQPLSEQDLLEMTLELPAEKLQTPRAADDSASEPQTDADIMQAFSDNRMLQYYQPIMPLSETATESGREYYSIRIRMVDTNGEIINAEQIVDDLKNARNQKLLDRWMLRQTVSKVVSFSQNEQEIPELIIKLSEESFADASLFQWLQNKLMKQLARVEPGKSVTIEVAAETYLARERQVEALFKFLRQSYGFRFAMSSFSSIEQLDQCIGKGRFSLYKIDQKLLADIQSRQSDPTAIPEQILKLRQKGVMVVATFIEDASMLTQAINCGADFAMGYFIGEPVDNIGEVSQIESFEIT